MSAGKLTVSELLRLACIYAETSAQEVLDAHDHCDDESALILKEETRAFLKQLRAYRRRRWGLTRVEAVLAEARPVPLEEIASRPDHTFGVDG